MEDFSVFGGKQPAISSELAEEIRENHGAEVLDEVVRRFEGGSIQSWASLAGLIEKVACEFCELGLSDIDQGKVTIDSRIPYSPPSREI